MGTPYGYRHSIKGKRPQRQPESPWYFVLAVVAAVIIYIVLASF